MSDQPRPSSGESTKERAERIDREYYKRPDAFLQWKRALAVVALLAGIGWCAWGALDQERHYSPGPIANAHAMWENNCDACHLPFTPIRGDTWLSSVDTQRLLDAKCMACHKGPPHHALQKPEEVVGCASCHADHHGRDASLVSIDDHHCTNCHADLNAHRFIAVGNTEPLPAELAQITRFDNHHPEFRSAQQDLGKLKFSHRRHLAAGLRFAKDDRFKAWAWKDIPEADRARFNRHNENEDAEVTLDCATCHKFDASSVRAGHLAALPDAVLPQRTNGAYALPIVYENHCAACHPLNYDPDATSSLKTVSHRLSAEKIRDFLEANYAETFLKQDETLLESRSPLSSLPVAERREDLKTIGEQVNEKIRRTATFLRGRCAECHVLKDRELMVRDASIPKAELWFEVVPTNVPQVWLPKARFDHLPHRALDCKVCHAGAYPVDSLTSERSTSIDNDHVLIPTKAICMDCHAAKPTKGRVGARFDCVECHAYHDLDHPLAGLGSPARDAAEKHTLEQFIRAEVK